MPAETDSTLGGLERPFSIPAIPFRHEPFVVGALLELGRSLGQRGESRLAASAKADTLVRENPFAFFVAVLLDQGVPAERAFGAPAVLEGRIGTLTPALVSSQPDALREAMARRPMPHRFPRIASDWILKAADRLVTEYGGDASRLWSDAPTARELQHRLTRFVGIGQKKAAMTVEILNRDLGVEIRELSGSDVAVDVHIRRVFMRTGLSSHEDDQEIIHSARVGNPSRPGELDVPAWIIGRTWCRPRNPRCTECAVSWACPSAPEPPAGG